MSLSFRRLICTGIHVLALFAAVRQQQRLLQYRYIIYSLFAPRRIRHNIKYVRRRSTRRLSNKCECTYIRSGQREKPAVFLKKLRLYPRRVCTVHIYVLKRLVRQGCGGSRVKRIRATVFSHRQSRSRCRSPAAPVSRYAICNT